MPTTGGIALRGHGLVADYRQHVHEVVLAGLREQALAQTRRPRLEPRHRLPGGLDDDPCGIVIEAEMTSASSAGTKRKPGRPDSTRPRVTTAAATTGGCATWSLPPLGGERQQRRAPGEDAAPHCLTAGGTNKGPRLVAYDKTDGAEMASVDLPSGGIGTPMTYRLGGRAAHRADGWQRSAVHGRGTTRSCSTVTAARRYSSTGCGQQIPGAQPAGNAPASCSRVRRTTARTTGAARGGWEMDVTLNLTPELGHRLQRAARKHGVSADEYTLRLLDRHVPGDGQAAALVSLLQSWIDEEDDAGEQRETGEYLVRALDEDRLSGRQLFPTEHKGVTW